MGNPGYTTTNTLGIRIATWYIYSQYRYVIHVRKMRNTKCENRSSIPEHFFDRTTQDDGCHSALTAAHVEIPIYRWSHSLMAPPSGGAIMRITMSIEMISIRLCVLSRSVGDEMKLNENKMRPNGTKCIL